MNTFVSFRRHSPRLLGAFLIVAAAFATAPAAHADTAPPRITVQYGDLDLGRAAGAATLYARLHAAAGAVCGSAHPSDVRAVMSVRLCREQAIARAVASVDHPGFSEWHAVREGRALPGGQRVAQHVR
jgi:UrcA family protein